jgi:hypothetical protein
MDNSAQTGQASTRTPQCLLKGRALWPAPSLYAVGTAGEAALPSAPVLKANGGYSATCDAWEAEQMRLRKRLGRRFALEDFALQLVEGAVDHFAKSPRQQAAEQEVRNSEIDVDLHV